MSKNRGNKKPALSIKDFPAEVKNFFRRVKHILRVSKMTSGDGTVLYARSELLFIPKNVRIGEQIARFAGNRSLNLKKDSSGESLKTSSKKLA